MRTRRKALGIVGIAAATMMILASCSSSGGKEAQEDQQKSVSGQADTEEITVAMITHAVPGDTFWDQVRTGAKAAAAKDNVDLQYSNDPDGSKQATLIRNAVDQEVDGIAVTLAHPGAVRGAVKEAIEAGIPVVGLNAGVQQWEKFGMMSFFGQDETIAGKAFGEKLNETGAENVVCVNHEQGSVQLEARCSGLKQAFNGNTEVLYVKAADMADVRSRITAKLQSASNVDHVVTLGAPFAMTALKSVDEAGSDASVVTFDLNSEVVDAIKSGDIPFAVDQQPYLQGYMAVDSLWLYEFNGAKIGGGEPVLTGPTFVTEDNISDLARFN